MTRIFAWGSQVLSGAGFGVLDFGFMVSDLVLRVLGWCWGLGGVMLRLFKGTTIENNRSFVCVGLGFRVQGAGLEV